MSYPDYPNNTLVVGGVNLSTQFHMVLSDGYTLEPPEPKTYTVDIPSGNGKLDLTESLMGDSVYNDRKQEFTFYVIDAANFEQTKTAVSNFLHGRDYDYQLTMDPLYTYHGRFSVKSYQHTAFASGILGAIVISVDAHPFKQKALQTLSVNAVAGNTVQIQSGRMRVRPTIITNTWLRVIYNRKVLTLQQGTWKINDLLLTQGANEIYFNNYDARSLRWGHLKDSGVTWEDFKDLKLYEWYRSHGTGILEERTWDQIEPGTTWANVANQRWYDLMYVLQPASQSIENITVQYEWGDL